MRRGLCLVGLGLWDEKDLTLRGLEKIRECDVVFFEGYTNMTGTNIKGLEELIGKKVKVLRREDVESDTLIHMAKSNLVGLIVPGDPLVATTHIDLVLRAKEQGVKVCTIHNASIYTAVAESGLMIYKFGKTTTIPFWSEHFKPTSFYDTILENLEKGLHTLVLLDVKMEDKKIMDAKEGIEIGKKVEGMFKRGIFVDDRAIVVCCRLGSEEQRIVYGPIKRILEIDMPKPPHCIIIPGKLHPTEEEMLRLYGV